MAQLRNLHDQDGTGAINITLRFLQTFFTFILVCIYISIASFQASWKVGPSFLTALALFFAVQGLIQGGILLATPLMADKIKFLASIERTIRQIRVAVLINASQVILMLFMALISSISAYGGGCKDPSSDEHAAIVGYSDAMGPFCRNKRAAAAFWWFTLLSWSASLGIVLLTFRAIRKNPTSSAFDIPGSQFPADDEEAFAPSDTDSPSQGYRASGDYYAAEGESRLFGESVKGYGGGRGGEFHPVVKDPFEDQQKGEYEMRYDGADPYEAIRKSMDVHRPTY